MRDLITTLAFLLPFKRLKVRILNLVGHDIHPTCYLGINLVRHVGRIEMAEGSAIGNFNVIGGLKLVKLGRGARINYLNLVMIGFTTDEVPDPRGIQRTLQLGEQSRVISFHVFDCSGGVIIGDDCWVTGLRTTFLTHAFDPHQGGIIVEPIEMKNGSLIATSCTLLPGSVVGEGSLLAAGSTAWTRQELKEGSLHGGVPARRLAPLEVHDWVYTFQRYPDA